MEDAANVLKTILAKMGVEHEVVSSETEERITLEVKGPETGLVIGKKGQTLDSLQYMVNKIVSKKLGDTTFTSMRSPLCASPGLSQSVSTR